MTTIIVTHEDNEIDEFEFDADMASINIGRRSTNDVCIPNLSVSGQHARISQDGDDVIIEDLNSTNGTYINGRLISRQQLQDGDEIIIGKARVVYRQGDPLQAAPARASERAEAVTARADSMPVHDEPAPTTLLPSVAAAAAKSASLDDLLATPVAKTSTEPSAKSVQNPAPEPAAPEPMVADGLDDSMNSGSLSDDDSLDDQPMTLSEKAKLALGRTPNRPHLQAISNAAGARDTQVDAAARLAPGGDSDVAVQDEPPTIASRATDPHPLDGLDQDSDQKLTHELDKPRRSQTSGAVIEIKNGAKSGQVLPIDKPVTTLGRPGIQIAAIMRKPDGYFLMHIESDDSVDRPTLNQDVIGDEPVLLHSGDELNVAGIDVEFMLS